MLVLSRKLGEKIYIGRDVCVTIVRINSDKIRLGIEAPNGVPIFRSELMPDFFKPEEEGADDTVQGQSPVKG